MISVVVPNYNHSCFLKQRLDSIINQTVKDIEIIILDDCSSDESRKVIEQYRDNPKVSRIEYNAENSGSPFPQWIKGVDIARGEWIWIAESDDWADDSFLEYMLGEAASHPNCGLVYSIPKKEIKSYSRLCAGTEPVEYKGTEFVRMLAGQIFISNVSSIIFKRDAFLSIDSSLFRDMKMCGDWFCYTLLAEKTDILYCPESHAYFRIHDNNTSTFNIKRGMDFREGIEVLEYIRSKYPVNGFRVNLVRGERLAICRKRIGIDDAVFRQLRREYGRKYFWIFFWARIYSVRLLFLGLE